MNAAIIKAEEQIEKLHELESKIFNSFDKVILTLSTFSLSLTILFIEKVIVFPEAKWTILVYLSWVGFLLTILLNLSNYIIAHFEIQNLIKAIEKSIQSTETPAEFKSITSIVNILTAVFYFISILIFMIFVGVNYKSDSAHSLLLQKKTETVITDRPCLNSSFEKLHDGVIFQFGKLKVSGTRSWIGPKKYTLFINC